MTKKVPNKATVIKVDGSITELDHRPTLKEAQEIVGGYIEFIRVGSGKILVVDDEGKMKNKTVNKIITDTYGSKIYGGYVVGDVIVLEGWRTVG